MQGEKAQLDPTIRKLRDRTWLSLSLQTANAAGMTLAQLQQFTLGGYSPTQVQLNALARLYECCRG